MSRNEDVYCPDVHGLQTLPDETLISIFRYLHFKDLLSIALTCHRFSRLSFDDTLWKWQCSHYFLENRSEEDTRWKDRFVSLYRDFGKYPDYKVIKSTWNKIEKYLEKQCPTILASLNGPVSEAALDAFERRTAEKLPLDMRASYRIHDGQARHSDCSGLMGGGMLTSHVRSDALLPFSIVHQTYLTDGHTAGCVMLTKDLIGHSLQLIAISNSGGFSRGHVYDATSYEYSRYGLDCFVAATSFKEWLCDYADKLTQDQYFILPEEFIIKFYHEPSCVATTSGITVKPTTCFIPELSSLSPPQVQYFFAYRIMIEMSEDAPSEYSCRLETRHWIITAADGQVTAVDGPGVVGEYPVMSPGKKYSWISCCTFDTPSGSMEGYFTFRNLQDGSTMEIECPCYHMQALPSLTAIERQEIVRQLNQTQPENG